MLIVNAKITAKQDYILEVKKALELMVPLTLKEEGCLAYELYEAIEEKNIFIFHEKWESREFLEKHLASKHFANFAELAKKMLMKPVEIYLLKKV